MNLSDVIEVLTEERSLDREAIISVVKDGVRSAYLKKYPDLGFDVRYNTKLGEVEVYVEKEVVSHVEDKDFEISLRKARAIRSDVAVGDIIYEPFLEPIGRVEMMIARQYIANNIRDLEQRVVYEEFKEKEGTIVNGMIHKRERAGFVVKMGDVMAFLPMSCTIPEESLRVGFPVRALLKEVLAQSRGEHQLILDRASEDFVRKLIELEIPEVYEGIVTIKNLVRAPGYKTKIVVVSNSSDIDPVGTCVGVGGVRIKPILKELGREKIDLVEHTDDLEELVATALKPAEIDKVSVDQANRSATVWLAQDQRSFAIGKQGQNISLVSRLTDLNVQLQNDESAEAQADAIFQEHAQHLREKTEQDSEEQSEE